MTTLAEPGVPAGGFKTVGQIRATNGIVFRRDQNAMELPLNSWPLISPVHRSSMNEAPSSASSASSTFFARWKPKRILPG